MRAWWVRVVVSAVLLLAAASAGAQISERTLDNGLKVIVVEDHKVPLATFQVWYRVGARNEPARRTGISHLLEHMMFKGTPKYGSKVFSKLVQKNGGMDNGYTTRDYTTYFQILSSDRIALSVELEADRMQNLTLDPKEVNAERNVVLEERRMRYEDDPQNALFEEVMAAAFKAHPYGNPVIGWKSDLEAITREDLLGYYRSYYAPDNAFILVAGDVDPGEVLRNVEEHFGGIPKGSGREAVSSVEPRQRGERRVYLRKEAQLPYVLVFYHAPNFPHRDSYALDVLAGILSGKSGRLYQNVVYTKKLALEAYGEYDNFSLDPLGFFLGATAAPGADIGDVEEALYKEVESLVSSAPSAEEIQKAKNQVEASFIMSQDSLYMQARLTGMFEMLGGWRLKEDYVAGIRSVTAEEVQKVAKEYFGQDNRTVGILLPESAGGQESE